MISSEGGIGYGVSAPEIGWFAVDVVLKTIIIRYNEAGRMLLLTRFEAVGKWRGINRPFDFGGRQISYSKRDPQAWLAKEH